VNRRPLVLILPSAHEGGEKEGRGANLDPHDGSSRSKENWSVLLQPRTIAACLFERRREGGDRNLETSSTRQGGGGEKIGLYTFDSLRATNEEEKCRRGQADRRQRVKKRGGAVDSCIQRRRNADCFHSSSPGKKRRPSLRHYEVEGSFRGHLSVGQRGRKNPYLHFPKRTTGEGGYMWGGGFGKSDGERNRVLSFSGGGCRGFNPQNVHRGGKNHEGMSGRGDASESE